MVVQNLPCALANLHDSHIGRHYMLQDKYSPKMEPEIGERRANKKRLSFDGISHFTASISTSVLQVYILFQCDQTVHALSIPTITLSIVKPYLQHHKNKQQ